MTTERYSVDYRPLGVASYRKCLGVMRDSGVLSIGFMNSSGGLFC
jgi:hypothetical protein